MVSVSRVAASRLRAALVCAFVAAFAGAAVAATDCCPALRLEARLEPAQVPVGAQALYRLRWIQGIDVAGLELVGPAARLAEVRPLGEERLGESIEDGKRVRVRERTYAIFPFASGAVEITGAHAVGRVGDAQNADGPDGRRALRIDAPVLTLDVEPAPAHAGPWLPARRVSLHDDLDPPPDGPHVGRSLQRTLRIEAVGLDAASLPELLVEAPGLRVHPGAVRLHNGVVGEWNVGVREQTYTLVPLRPGPIRLPAIELAWWDVAARAPAVARLTERSLAVAGAAPAASTPRQTAAPAVAQAAAAVAAPAARMEAAGTPRRAVIALVAAVALTAAVALAWRGRALIAIRWRLLRACQRRQPAELRDALLALAARRAIPGPPRTLLDLADRLPDARARASLAAIERQLYGPDRAAVSSATLRRAAGAVWKASSRAPH
jgi:hypothetical protein